MKPKPCPFCGAKAKNNASGINGWFIDHTLMCWLGRNLTQVFDSKEVHFWNRRHSTKRETKGGKV